MNGNMCNMSELTRKELGKLLGVDASTISRHKAKGLPINPDGKTYNGTDCIQWLIERVEKAASKDSGESDESRRWLTAFRKERAKTARLERLVKEKKFLPFEELDEEWGWRAGVYRSGLLAFSSRLPPLLKGKKQLQMRDILHKESCLLLAALSKDHQYCPRDALPKGYTELDKLATKLDKLEAKKKPASKKKGAKNDNSQ